MKICKKCNKEKDLSNFKKEKSCKQGVAGTCKECLLGRPVHKPATDFKQCLGCSITKPIENFSLNGKDLKYRKSYCKTCVNKVTDLKRQGTDKLYIRLRKKTLRQKYKMDLNTYNQMFQDQQGKCKTCNREVTKTLHVDHCHKTNKIRGLLCMQCNTGLGMVDDNIEILENLINYLKNS